MFDAQSVEAMGVGLAGLGVWHAGASVYRLGSLRGRRLGASLAGLSLSKEPVEGWRRVVSTEVRQVVSDEGRQFVNWGLVPGAVVAAVWVLTHPGIVPHYTVPATSPLFQLFNLVNGLAWYGFMACLGLFLLAVAGTAAASFLAIDSVKEQGMRAVRSSIEGALMIAMTQVLLSVTVSGMTGS